MRQDHKTIRMFGCTLSFRSFVEVAHIFKDIFIDQEYKFVSETSSPYILDCGAHIGLATMYFISKYPKAKIVCFEPNPDTYRLLNLNIKQNKLAGVETVNSAVAGKAGVVNFYTGNVKRPSWSWGDSIFRKPIHGEGDITPLKIKAVVLSKFITKQVDLLKLDVEGAETEVFTEIKDKLHFVKNIVFEFHGLESNQKNNIDYILSLLEENNFEVQIKQNKRLVKPGDIIRKLPFWLIVSARQK